MSLRLAFYIRIELDRSNVDGRNFQAHPDKMLCFQWLYGFRRKHPIPLNFPETIENTRRTGFSCFAEDSSQTVVTLCRWRRGNLEWTKKLLSENQRSGRLCAEAPAATGRRRSPSALQTVHKKAAHKLHVPVAFGSAICYTNGVYTTAERKWSS